MRKTITLVLLPCILTLSAAGQVREGQIDLSRIPSPAPHYQEEYSFDTTVNPGAWSTQSKGLHVSFASTDRSFFRSEVPAISGEKKQWAQNGWKGERLNAQVLVWSPDTLGQIRFILSDLRTAKGQSISRKSIKVHMVRYVVSNYPYGAKDATCGVSEYGNVYLMPDRFEEFERFDLPGRTVRPVWISVDIPAGTTPGLYRGTIEIRSEHQTALLSAAITVQNQVLPPPHEWKHRLDLWQNPWAVAWENHLRPWSNEHITLLKKHLKLYADAGGTYITTYAVHSPWADNSYMQEGGMIEWIKKKNGAWKFDYTLFDTYVSLAMSLGIDRAITIYTPVPWGFRFRYTEEETGNQVYESWPPDSPEYRTNWNAFLTDLEKHLEQKGWMEKTYLGINENEMKETLAAIKVIRDHSKKWKITYAGDWHPELDSLLDDYCFLFGKEAGVGAVKQRTERGKTTTYYVCCNPPVPNNFLFSPPVEGRWQGWYSAAHGYSGFLRWAYDAWPADPLRDARHPFWPAGDCFLVYPGGNSCIRFEKLREGISDYEKIRLLKERAARSGDPRARQLLAQLNQHLQTFLQEKDFQTEKITSDLEKGQQILQQLSEVLGR